MNAPKETKAELMAITGAEPQSTEVEPDVAGDTQVTRDPLNTLGSEPAAQQSDEDVIASLAAMNPLEYDRVRNELALVLNCWYALKITQKT
jgi:hypothetical protein